MEEVVQHDPLELGGRPPSEHVADQDRREVESGHAEAAIALADLSCVAVAVVDVGKVAYFANAVGPVQAEAYLDLLRALGG